MMGFQIVSVFVVSNSAEILVLPHLLDKVLRTGDSKVTFSVFESN